MPSPLWQPRADARSSTRLGAFADLCEQRTGLGFATYDDLWQWSVGTGLEECWAAVWDFFDVRSSAPHTAVLAERTMPGARWFPGARLNFAEHILRNERPGGGLAHLRGLRASPPAPAAVGS